MKELIITIALLILFAVMFAGCATEPKVIYDSNNPIYKFIPPADDSWIEKFGDNDDTRMKHTISELRVVVAAQGNNLKAFDERLKVLETMNELGVSISAELTSDPVADPNEVKE